MLSINHMTAGSELYYTTLSAEDYYLNGGEPEGIWLGSGAKALRLGGRVKDEELKCLMQGFSPDGTPLVQNAGSTTGHLKRKPGWDLTFSAPKSVSVLWSQLDEDTRHLVQQAHLASVTKALQYLENNAAHSRTGKGGSDRAAAKLVVAAFEHGTSRALEPQLHTHCLVLNVGVRPDGSTGALLSKPFYQHKMLAGALYRLELGHQLQTKLGVKLERKDTWFEVARVPKRIMDHFSTRRKQIEAELGELGIETASAASYAALKTRSTKTVVPPRHELFGQWSAEGKSMSFGPSRAQQILGESTRLAPALETLKLGIEAAVTKLEQEKSTFTRHDLLLSSAHMLQGSGVTPERLLQSFDANLPGQLINLGVREDKQYFTTQKTLAIEKELLRAAETLNTTKVKTLPEQSVEALIKAPISLQDPKAKTRSITLSDEQARAVRSVTLNDAAISVITGLAGTGKTAMLAATKKAFEDAGYHVIGATPTHRARQQLQHDTGIETDSVAKRLMQLYPTDTYLAKHAMKQLWRAATDRKTYAPDAIYLSKKTVLVLDEASMVTTSDMKRLLEAVRDRGGRILLVGDEKQLPPVGPGGAFDAIIKRVGATSLSEVTRQKEHWQRNATRKMSAGDADAFLRTYAVHGCVTVEKSRPDVEAKLIGDWTEAGGVTEPQKHIMAAATNEQVDRYNDLAQKSRLKAGALDTRHSIRVGTDTLYAGDRVTFTKNSKKLQIFNGDTGTIIAVKDWGWTKAIAVKLDVPEKSFRTKTSEFLKHTAIQLLREAAGRPTRPYRPNDYAIRIIPIRTYLSQKYDGIRRAYAFTTHKLQGATVDNVYVALGDSMTSREMSYVQASRHRHALRLYTTEFAAGEKLTKLARGTSPPPMLDIAGRPVDEGLESALSDSMKRSSKEPLAHDLFEQNRKQHYPTKSAHQAIPL